MFCIALFVYKNENLYSLVRNEIVNYLNEHKNEFAHLEIETEDRIKNIDEFLLYITDTKIWSGELEIYADEEIYNINIVDYIQFIEKKIIKIIHNYFFNYNHDNKNDKDLCILTNINYNHYNLLFDKKIKVFKNNK